MTKTILLILALFLTSLFSNASGTNTSDTLTKTTSPRIASLIINATVTVVLVSDEQALLVMDGDAKFRQFVSLKTTGDTLVIETAKNKNLLGRVTVYVPASALQKLQINSAATVRSYSPLNVPKLDVVFNGECVVNVSNIGALNCIETADFSVEQSTEVRRLPQGLIKKKA